MFVGTCPRCRDSYYSACAENLKNCARCETQMEAAAPNFNRSSSQSESHPVQTSRGGRSRS